MAQATPLHTQPPPSFRECGVASGGTEAECPPYTCSARSPPYSCIPLPTEQILDLSFPSVLDVGGAPPGATVVEKRNRLYGLTVRLHPPSLDPSSSYPSYGPGAYISGVIVVDRPENVRRVEVKLRAELRMTTSEGKLNTRTLFTKTVTPWRVEAGSTCPISHEFEIGFPAAYHEVGLQSSRGNQRWAIPPTFHFCDPLRVPGFEVHCEYKLVVKLIRRHLFYNTNHSLTLPINYSPRTRSPHSIPLYISPNSIEKSSLESFHQIETVITQPLPAGDHHQVQCDIYLPSSLTYAISQPIPFYLQLSGSRSSLESLGFSSLASPPSPSPPTETESSPSCLSSMRSRRGRLSASSTSTCSSGFKDMSDPDPKGMDMRVYILRQVIVHSKKQKSWRTMNIGEAELEREPLEEQGDGQDSSRTTPDTERLGWRGTIRIRKEVLVGGFVIADLVVQDYLVFSAINSPNSPNGVFHQYLQPIRLVTDPF